MLTLTRTLAADTAAATIADQLCLPFQKRQISRQRVTLVSGREAGLKVPRGSVLRGGDLLQSEDGETVEVVSAAETVSRVTAATARDLQRAAYHLGNRHVPVEVGEGWLAYLHDHVLDDMLRGLGGLTLDCVEQAFEPEAGAYHGHHSGHGGHHQHD